MKKVLSTMLMIASIAFLFSCSKDDDNPALSKTSITLHVNETEEITYNGNGKCTWSSDNKRVADVNDGVVTAHHVGTTTIYANNLSCKVTVKPRYTMFVEPYLGFGSSKSTVKKQMSGYSIIKDESTTLNYNGRGSIEAYSYKFEDDMLKSCAFYTGLSESLDLADFLIERYIVDAIDNTSYNEQYYYMTSVDSKYTIILYLDKKGCIVMYAPKKS